MNLNFYKYEGTGNDFIVFDNRKGDILLSAENIVFLCDRHFGIGADGVLLLQSKENYDFEMVYYNADGSQAAFCGNGGRCIVAFAKKLGIIDTEACFLAGDGIHKAKIIYTEENGKLIIELQMTDALIYKTSENFYYLNTGTYHVVSFVDNVNAVDVNKAGADIRHRDEYKPQGTNVNFVSYQNNILEIRTYEKGVEAETLACGTGITASAIAASLKYGGNAFNVYAKGGKLKVDFDKKNEKFIQVKLTGSAKFVFNGYIYI